MAVWLALLALPAGAGRAQGDDPAVKTLAERAAQTYGSAVSALRTRQYQQAQGLFEKYVSAYPTHERVAVGYLLLATCQSRLEDQDGYEKTLTEVTRRYPGSPAWFTAYRCLLDAARQAKDPDRYFQLLEAMVRAAGQAPWRIDGNIGWEYGDYWNREYNGELLQPQAGQLRGFLEGPGWVMGVAEMADTEQRAQRALQLLARNFQKLQAELSPDWQHVHVALLRRAGYADQADKALAAYAESWGDDPRRIELWQLRLDEATAAKDPAAAAAAFAGLTQGLFGADMLERPTYDYLVWLNGQKQHDEFVRLARRFLRSYPVSSYWHYVTWWWVNLARPAGGQEPPRERIESVLSMLDELHQTGDPNTERSELLWRIDLLGRLGRKDEAVKLAAELMSPANWSDASYKQIAQYALSDEAFAPVLAAARQKWNIPLPNPTSTAFVKLHELKRRLSADEVRHAEEIGEELFASHRQDASTIEAVQRLADYYFAKVLPEPRDKWMDRMIATWPTHPSTQAVLANQITAEYAAKRYDRLAKAIDTAEASFGGTVGAWHDQRMVCFSVANDPAGALAYARKVYGPRADAGEAWAMDRLAGYELAGKDQAQEFKAIGDYWMEKAKRFAGKPPEGACLRRAWVGYYWTPIHRWARDKVDYDGALAAVRAMRAQTRDAALRWQAAFGEVNLLAHKGEAQAAADALEKALGDVKTCRDLSLRLEFGMLGTALGTSGQLRRGTDLAGRLGKICFTTRDRCAIEVMLASMYYAAKDYQQAGEHYLSAVDAYPFPARMLPTFQSAASSFRQANSKRYATAMEAYLRQVGRVPEIVPALLHDQGYYYAGMRSAAALDVRKRLASGYPASEARDRLEDYIDRLYEQHRRSQR